MEYKKLLSAIEDRNISVRKLALMANITPQSLYAAIHGKSFFWPGWRRRIAEALGEEESALFPEVENDEKNQND